MAIEFFDSTTQHAFYRVGAQLFLVHWNVFYWPSLFRLDFKCLSDKYFFLVLLYI